MPPPLLEAKKYRGRFHHSLDKCIFFLKNMKHSSYSVIALVKVVLKRTVVGD